MIFRVLMFVFRFCTDTDQESLKEVIFPTVSRFPVCLGGLKPPLLGQIEMPFWVKRNIGNSASTPATCNCFLLVQYPKYWNQEVVGGCC